MQGPLVTTAFSEGARFGISQEAREGKSYVHDKERESAAGGGGGFGRRDKKRKDRDGFGLPITSKVNQFQASDAFTGSLPPFPRLLNCWRRRST